MTKQHQEPSRCRVTKGSLLMYLSRMMPMMMQPTMYCGVESNCA